MAEQRQDEMQSKFSLDFDIFSPGMVAASPSGNPFREARRMNAHHRNAYDEMDRTRRFALTAFPARELPARRRSERRRKAITR